MSRLGRVTGRAATHTGIIRGTRLRRPRSSRAAAIRGRPTLATFSLLAFGVLSAEQLLANPFARGDDRFTDRRAYDLHSSLGRSREPGKDPADGAAQKRLADRIILNGLVNLFQPPAFRRRPFLRRLGSRRLWCASLGCRWLNGLVWLPGIRVS